MAIPAGAAVPDGLLAERRGGEAGVVAYLCQGLECLSPITALDDLERELALMEMDGP